MTVWFFGVSDSDFSPPVETQREKESERETTGRGNIEAAAGRGGGSRVPRHL